MNAVLQFRRLQFGQKQRLRDPALRFEFFNIRRRIVWLADPVGVLHQDIHQLLLYLRVMRNEILGGDHAGLDGVRPAQPL